MGKKEETSLFYSVSFVFAPNANAEIIRDADREREREGKVREQYTVVFCGLLHTKRARLFVYVKGKAKRDRVYLNSGKKK